MVKVDKIELLEAIRTVAKTSSNNEIFRRNGHLYQSLPEIGLFEGRDTHERIREYDIINHITNKSVLIIGSDIGCIDILLAKHAKCIFALDPDPIVQKIQSLLIDHFEIKNIIQINAAFDESFIRNFSQKFDVILCMSVYSRILKSMSIDAMTRGLYGCLIQNSQSKLLIESQANSYFECFAKSKNTKNDPATWTANEQKTVSTFITNKLIRYTNICISLSKYFSKEKDMYIQKSHAKFDRYIECFIPNRFASWWKYVI